MVLSEQVTWPSSILRLDFSKTLFFKIKEPFFRVLFFILFSLLKINKNKWRLHFYKNQFSLRERVSPSSRDACEKCKSTHVFSLKNESHYGFISYFVFLIKNKEKKWQFQLFKYIYIYIYIYIVFPNKNESHRLVRMHMKNIDLQNSDSTRNVQRVKLELKLRGNVTLN